MSPLEDNGDVLADDDISILNGWITCTESLVTIKLC